ncbi:MAG: dipeptidase [Acidobacteriota bacterium]
MSRTNRISSRTLTATVIVLQLCIFLCVSADHINAQSALRKYVRDEKQAKALVDRILVHSPIIDGHSDLFAWYFGCAYKRLPKCPQDIVDYPLDTITKGQTDIPRWRKGGVGGVELNLGADSLSRAEAEYELLHRLEKAYAKDLKIVTTSSQMRNAISDGKIALLPMMEGTDGLGGKVSALKPFYDLGLRCMTFAYKTNGFADGSDDEPKHNGISAIGKELVAEMNRLGVIVDMSHISAKAMNDILDVTKAPVIFSHSNARKLSDINRNVPDDVLLRLKANRGLIMIDMVAEHVSNAFAKWMTEGDTLYFKTRKQFPNDKKKLSTVMKDWEDNYPRPVVTVVEVADHFDHVKRLIGVDRIGISGDYDGMDYPIKGLEDVSGFPHLLIELARRGWSERDLRKITGENYLRVFSEIEEKAAFLRKRS